MTNRIYLLSGYQTDFSQNWLRNGKEIYDGFRDTVEAGLQSAAKIGGSATTTVTLIVGR